jgi:hypothetical protein
MLFDSLEILKHCLLERRQYELGANKPSKVTAKKYFSNT